MRTALTIAGSDSIGGSGIQADIKTMTMNGVYAMSAITALTAQNTQGITDVLEVTPKFLAKQITAVFTDIPPDSVKVGMVSSASLIYVVAEQLIKFEAHNIVVDPLMTSTSGAKLINEDAIETLRSELLPLATLVTPNIPEAEILSGMKISNEGDMLNVAKAISTEFCCNVLLKGGHGVGDSNDLLYVDGDIHWFKAKRIDNRNTHGTGCTLSAAIAAYLAKGYTIEDAVQSSKIYVSEAIEAQLNLGRGIGPINHIYKFSD